MLDTLCTVLDTLCNVLDTLVRQLLALRLPQAAVARRAPQGQREREREREKERGDCHDDAEATSHGRPQCEIERPPRHTRVQHTRDLAGQTVYHVGHAMYRLGHTM